MFGRRKKIKELEKRIEELEKRIEELEKRFNKVLDVLDAEALSPKQKERQNEAVAVAQVMDEWLNGKKEGGK